MGIFKKSVLFYLGGGTYMTLEFLWRGRSSGSMFVLGGVCFLALGKLDRVQLRLPAKMLLGAVLVTALELGAGEIVNRNYQIWDYRAAPCNFRGQICLPYSLLWALLSGAGMILYRAADRKIDIWLGSDKI